MNAKILTIVLLKKNLLMLIISALAEEIESIYIAPKSELGGRARITKYKNIFSKGYTKNC